MNKELEGMGLVRTGDGFILDNKDGFYSDNQDFIGLYDSRTCKAINKTVIIRMFSFLNECQVDELLEGLNDFDKYVLLS